GIANGCKIAGCSLIGGETAEMPGFYGAGEYDLAGFAVGIAERKEIIDGSKIKEGDIIIGLSSSGLHSNGYSLARKLFFDIKKYNARKKIKRLDSSIGDELLKPTRIYVRSVLEIISKFKVKGMAHITGGGITENLPRILPEKKGLKAVIEKGSWTVPKIFSIIQNEGNVSEDEIYRTLNMGIGFILVVSKADVTKIIKKLNSLGEQAFVIGQIEKGNGRVTYI
ncbi:MAG: phosphoribosylformylglycinamidine cyclo-ligase, partial [Nitrospirota bacterium]